MHTAQSSTLEPGVEQATQSNAIIPYLYSVFILFFYFFKYLFIYYVYNILSVCMPAGQKRAPDLIDGCEPPCGCWELNSGPLEEQAVLLTTEPSLQPPFPLFIRT